MSVQIIIPAYNEEDYLASALNSMIAQTVRPDRIVVVNDGSSDSTQKIIDEFSEIHPFILSVTTGSTSKHSPGSKVVNAFYKGMETVGGSYDFIGKFDADILLPEDYFEKTLELFQQDEKVGIAGGNLYIEEDGSWVFESISEKTKVRGPIKLYRKACFEAIGGLKKSIGWDTVDELLAQYHGWKVVTDQTLYVKHLKPTGATYTKAAKYKQGEAFYKMRYGWALTQIAALKLATKKKSPMFYYHCMQGFLKAKRKKVSFLVTEEEGKFIRQLRWRNIRKKVF